MASPGHLPKDCWRLILSELAYPNLSVLRRTCRYFWKFLDDLTWYIRTQEFIQSQGFDPDLIFQLIHGEKLLTINQLCELNNQIVQSNSKYTGLFRTFYSKAEQRNKNYQVNIGIIGRFYSHQKDRLKYYGTVACYWQQTGLIDFTRDALDVCYQTNSRDFIEKVVMSGSIQAFGYFLEKAQETNFQYPSKLQSLFNLISKYRRLVMLRLLLESKIGWRSWFCSRKFYQEISLPKDGQPITIIAISESVSPYDNTEGYLSGHGHHFKRTTLNDSPITVYIRIENS